MTLEGVKRRLAQMNQSELDDILEFILTSNLSSFSYVDCVEFYDSVIGERNYQFGDKTVKIIIETPRRNRI